MNWITLILNILRKQHINGLYLKIKIESLSLVFNNNHAYTVCKYWRQNAFKQFLTVGSFTLGAFTAIFTAIFPFDGYEQVNQSQMFW